MANLQVEVVTRGPQTLYGVWGAASDKTVAKDIPALTAVYYQTLQAEAGSVLPFFVLSRNYDEATRGFELFIGGTKEAPGLAALELPAGPYGKLTVGPKLGFAWGPAIGQAKGYFYTKWLPSQPYRALNLEFELHTEKALGKHPTVELFFALAGVSAER